MEMCMRFNPKGQKRHDSLLRKKYGIGLHQYQQMFEDQKGQCYICEKEDWRNLAVDHDHLTGEVRGLLCTTCNTGLGQFKDSVDLLMKAIEYVSREYKLPSDIHIPTTSQADRPRWRNVVVTPRGSFASYDAAAKVYGVHPTSIGYWCGTYKNYPHLKQDGFESKKVFCSLNHVESGEYE